MQIIGSKNHLVTLSLLLIAMAVGSCTEEKATYRPKTLKDFEGHTICVLEGSMQQDYVMSHMNDDKTKFITFASSTDCMVATNQGKADAFFGASLYAYNEAFHRQHLMISAEVDDIDAPVAFGFKKGNDELTDDYNAFQDSLENAGELIKMVERWFNPENTDFHNCVTITPTDGKASQSKNILRVGIAGVKPPAEVMIDNKWTGFEIEMLQRYAASRGLNLNIESYDFGNLIPALQTGKIDIASATMAINEERKAKINFANEDSDIYQMYSDITHFCMRTGLQYHIFNIHLILEEILMETAKDSRPVNIDVFYGEKDETLEIQLKMFSLRSSIMERMNEYSSKIVKSLCAEFSETIMDDGLLIKLRPKQTVHSLMVGSMN